MSKYFFIRNKKVAEKLLEAGFVFKGYKHVPCLWYHCGDKNCCSPCPACQTKLMIFDAYLYLTVREARNVVHRIMVNVKNEAKA